MERTDSPVLYSLQIGRALAAIFVLIYHAALGTRTAYPFIPDSYFKLLSLGHFGVDYFFVLSGFIIAHATRNLRFDRAGAAHYFRARFIRVYVPYLPVAIVMVAVLTFLPGISLGAGSQHSVLASLLLPSNGFPALSVAWTLQHEVVFYLLFGLCLFGFKQPKLIFLWFVPMLFLIVIEPAHWAYIIADIINAEFLFGIGAYSLYRRGLLSSIRVPLIVVGLVLILISFVMMYGKEHFEFQRLITGFGYACIVLGCAYLEREVDFSRFRRLIYFGTISYSIYLIHGPVISLLLRIMGSAAPHWTIAFLLFCLAACVGGMLYFTLVEKPLMTYAKKRYCFRHIVAVTAP